MASGAIADARLHRKSRDAVHARDEVLWVVSHDPDKPLNNPSQRADMLLEDAHA